MVSALLLTFAVQNALVYWATREVARFLRSHDTIDDAAALGAFKALARRNMFGAVASMALHLIALALAILVIKAHGSLGTAVVLAGVAASYFVGANLLKLERRTWALQCATPQLEAVHRAVVHAWRKKMLPDF